MSERSRTIQSAQRLAVLGAVLLAGCTPANGAVSGEPAQTPAVAFVNATVIPMDRERTLSDHTVIVRGGRIAQVGPSSQVQVPSGTTVIDARGKFLMPGLAEMHAHIPAATGGMEAVERTLLLYSAAGVTTIRGMQGSPLHLELRQRTASTASLAPRIYAAGPSVSGNSARTPEAAAALVAAQKAAGYDLLKIQTGLTRESFDAMDAAADRLGIPYAGHIPSEVGLNRALEARYASIDHLDGYMEALAGYPDRFSTATTGFFGFNVVDRVDTTRIAALAAATRAAGVWNAPTLTLLEHLASADDPEVMAQRPEMKYMPPATIQQWIERKRAYRAEPAYTPERARRYLEVREQILRGLQRAGAGILLSSDAPQWWNVPGFSTRRELESMVRAGLTPYQALESGTRNAAVYFGAERDWGTIATGLSADLVLLNANPLTNIANVWQQAGVMVRGEWTPQVEIERRLAEAAAALR